jgi:hypothetical protein
VASPTGRFSISLMFCGTFSSGWILQWCAVLLADGTGKEKVLTSKKYPA